MEVSAQNGDSYVSSWDRNITGIDINYRATGTVVDKHSETFKNDRSHVSLISHGHGCRGQSEHCLTLGVCQVYH
jgi:hypothetical protein